MLIVDATCCHCDKDIRWLPGTPRICEHCAKRLNRLSSPPQETLYLATDDESIEGISQIIHRITSKS